MKDPGGMSSDGSTFVVNVASTVQIWSTPQLDNQGPTITALPSRPPDLNGLYNAPVIISFECSDPAGVASCPLPQEFTDDSRSEFAASATDNLGNESMITEAISLDFTPPTVEIIGVSEGDTIPAATPFPEIVCEANDLPAATGQIVGVCELSINEEPPGFFTVTATASDSAGFTTTETVRFEAEQAVETGRREQLLAVADYLEVTSGELNSKDARRVVRAVRFLRDGADQARWDGSDTLVDRRAFNRGASALRQLDAVKAGDERLAEVQRSTYEIYAAITVSANDAAVERCGRPHAINKAARLLRRAEYQTTKGNYARAVTLLRTSWNTANRA